MKFKSIALLLAAAISFPVFAAELPIPAPFKGKKVIVRLGTRDFTKNKSYKVMDDAKSIYGKATYLDENDKGKVSSAGTFAFGVYDQQNKRAVCSRAFNKTTTPQNEKYNLIRVGKITLKHKRYYFYGSASWIIQTHLASIYNPKGTDAENTYEVFVSAKFQGALFVPKSTKPELFAVDAVYLVQ